MITGEVLGLEIARIIDDDDGARLEVGVGRHDREAFAMLHGDLPTRARARRRWSRRVRQHPPSSGARPPAPAPGPERWLRDLVVAAARRSPAPRRSNAPRARAACWREGVVPAAAAASAATADRSWSPARSASTSTSCRAPPTLATPSTPRRRLVLVVPERDDHDVTRDAGRRPALAAASVRSSTITGLTPAARPVPLIACWSASPVWSRSSPMSRRAWPTPTCLPIRPATPTSPGATRSSTPS